MSKSKPSADLLGDFLQQKRQVAGFSQADVSTKLGYSTPQFVSNWERGVAHPPINVIKKLGQLYNVSAEELFEVVVTAKVQEVTRDLRRKFYGR